MATLVHVGHFGRPLCSGQALPLLLAGILAAALAIKAAAWCARKRHLAEIPLANPPSWLFFSRPAERVALVRSAAEALLRARDDFPHGPFRFLSDWGELLILPPEFAEEIRNEPKLSFGLAAMRDNHANIPGFETVRIVGRDDQLLQAVARKHLTKHLAKAIEPLCAEASLALAVNLGESPDWQTVRLQPAVLDIIARLSSRVYLGEQLCRSQDWLAVTKTYATAFYAASSKLRMFPRALRPLVHWWMPECRRLRAQRRAAEAIIRPLVRRRQQAKQAAAAAGHPAPVFHDALEWAEQEAATAAAAAAAGRSRSCDPVVFQLALSLLAIHTTYDLLQQAMTDLASNPQYIGPLRDEVARVVGQDGWSKASLYKMKLLDSALKETQRLKPGSIVTMRRVATDDVALSSGLVLKKGTRVNVDNRRMTDAAVYADPRVYNPWRFYQMRLQPGKEHVAQLVSTSPDHLGFGHGLHSCPGRFFAANEVKVALGHMLLKYDWKLAPATDKTPDCRGMLAKASPTTDVMIRRRHDEADTGAAARE
ncbi:uncharacterized protein UV8b_06094 [Ustilaginoidea virens]|uniref:Uncharacterized protein n=1 Tax=Ustilaginoidea virens TaxID=1159556 RepID=A0A063BIE2_USTVR|nr:uncharacterized protein UV8b_06094 [Ustilaginoidea virens]QUC21853.1 hypothetical protein UV8b_06094 [Ustilaginoidea virens]GAO19703.1 hypothetical protein UVI_02064320 [Ustilaginoidea virens]